MRGGVVEDEARDGLGRRVGGEGVVPLACGLKCGEEGVLRVEQLRVIQRCVSPAFDYPLDVLEVPDHAPGVEGSGGQLDLDKPVVAEEMTAGAFVMEQAMAVAEADEFRHAVHGGRPTPYDTMVPLRGART